MDTDVRDVRCHLLNRVLPAGFEELLVASRLKLEDGRTELEALRPFCPPARRVGTGDGKDRRAFFGGPRFLNG